MARDFKQAAAAASEAGKLKATITEATSTSKKEKKPAEKLPRINLALTPEQFDYIKTVAKASGQTQQGFIQKIITDYMAEHKKAYKAAKDLFNSL